MKRRIPSSRKSSCASEEFLQGIRNQKPTRPRLEGLISPSSEGSRSYLQVYNETVKEERCR